MGCALKTQCMVMGQNKGVLAWADVLMKQNSLGWGRWVDYPSLAFLNQPSE
jgi:hypothetical protein